MELRARSAASGGAKPGLGPRSNPVEPLSSSRRLVALTLSLVLLAPVAASGADRFHFNVILEGRVLTTPVSTSFLDGGLGKTRYGHEPGRVEATLAQAALLGRVDLRPDLTLRAHVNIDAEHNFERRVDLVEGLIRYNPAITDAVSLDLRAGVFFPTVSLENVDAAWLSPYTTTFSAINSWIGEEVRSVGVEGGPSFRLGEMQARVFGTIAKKNDPNGTLLAWRGFAMHDRVSGFADRLPLPPLKSFDQPNLFPDQPPHVQPFREVDDLWTWSTGVSITHSRFRVKGLFQPQTADPGSFDGEQYAWRTGYLALGASGILGPIEILAQGLDGETRMGELSEGRNAVVAKFQAAYVMASWTESDAAKHRLSARYDAFRVRDHDDFKVEDSNDESGSAWTLAYSFTPTPRHRITTELLRVDSTRTNRRDLALDPRAVEILATLSWRLTF